EQHVGFAGEVHPLAAQGGVFDEARVGLDVGRAARRIHQVLQVEKAASALLQTATFEFRGERYQIDRRISFVNGEHGVIDTGVSVAVEVTWDQDLSGLDEGGRFDEH